MISHEHKCIFIHIPKTGGMSIYNFFYPEVFFHQNIPNYDILFGWCPIRKIHLQHATASQLLGTGLISPEQWNSYFKFTFVRNPWDRAYSDYLYIKNFSGVKGPFRDYIKGEGAYKSIMSDNSDCNYMGDHLLPQSSFFEKSGLLQPNYVGRFERFSEDISNILRKLKIQKAFDVRTNFTAKRRSDYSKFFTDTKRILVETQYSLDIENFQYSFNDRRKGIYFFKKFL